MEFFWLARRAGEGIDRVWQPGDPVDSLPQCNMVLGLWGVVSDDERALDGNIPLAREAHRIARHCGADRVFHASSAAVYMPRAKAQDEGAPCAPRNAYGAAKLRMERAAQDEVPHPVCLRIGNVAGADGLFSALARGGDITLDRFDDKTGPARSYVAPRTLARVIAALARLPEAALPRAVNIGGRRPVAMEDIVSAAGRGLIWRPAPDGALPVMALDVTRLEALVELDDESSDAAELVAQWRRYGPGQ